MKVKESTITKYIADEAGITYAQAQDAKAAFVNAIILGVAGGDEIQLRGFGRFEVVGITSSKGQKWDVSFEPSELFVKYVENCRK